MTSKTKTILTAVVSFLVIAGSVLWIYFTQYRAPKFNVLLHHRVGEVMAIETKKLIGEKGRVVIIAMSASHLPELETQLAAFKERMKKQGDYEFRDYEVDTEGRPKYGLGTGLSGRHFVRTVKKNLNAAVFVSFLGAPKLTDEEAAELAGMPKFIAETGSPYRLPKLFENKIIQTAVVSRFLFPAPGPIKPKTANDWFDKRYQVITHATASLIPKAEPEPDSTPAN